MRLNWCVCPLFRILFYSYIYIYVWYARYAKTGLPISIFLQCLRRQTAGYCAINHSARIIDKRLILTGQILYNYELAGLTIEGSPPLALTNGVWTVLPRLPEIDLGYPSNYPSGDERPLLASLPLDGFAENVVPSSAAADDASDYDPPCREPDSDDFFDDDSEEGDLTDSDGDDEDDEDGAAL